MTSNPQAVALPGSGPLAVILADVSMGYGTPQLLRMAQSLCDVFGARVQILEPDQIERPQIDISKRIPGRDVSMERVVTRGHTFELSGRIEFAEIVAGKINALKPDILVMSGLHRLPVIDKIRGFSPFKIFYCLEEIEGDSSYLFPLADKCDMVIFPEENRKRIYSERLRLDPAASKSVVVYNSNRQSICRDPSEKNNRILLAGSFHRDITLASHFENEAIYKLPIDIFGIIDGFSPEQKAALLSNFSLDYGTRFKGYMQSNEEYFEIISKYLFSIVMWKPDSEDRLNAAPNKLFDALGAGIPPIAAPHPQCQEIITRYQCGILMSDWSVSALSNALNYGLSIAKTEEYQEMAKNCQKAMMNYLSWDNQFEKIAPYIRESI